MINFFFSGLFIILLVLNLSSIGYFFFQKEKINKNFNESIYLLIGLSSLVIYLRFIFYLTEFNSIEIFIFFLIISSFFLIACFIFKDGFYEHAKKLIIIIIPVILFYLTLSYLYGEQFYVFRGNKWDWFAFVTSSHYLNNIDAQDFLGLKNNFNWNNFDKLESKELTAYHENIKIWLLRIVDMYLLGSFFLNLKFNSTFFNLYLFKIFSLITILIPFIDFIKKYSNQKNFFINYLLSLVFIFSFWILYIVEADYYRQLISFGFFIYLICTLDDLFLDFENKKFNKIIITAIFYYSLFLLYPELLFIYLFILFLTFLLYKKKIYILKANYHIFLIILLGFFLISLPSYELILRQIIGQLGSTSSENRWWTYFGAFFFGRSSPAIDIEFANSVKELIYNTKNISGAFDNVTLIDIIKIITFSISNFNYENTYLSVIPSLAGFYFITDLFKFNGIQIFNFIFLIILNLYLIFTVLKNLFTLSLTKDNKIYNLKISTLSFLVGSIIFILQGKLWTFIKFYMYFSPVIFLLVLFKFKDIKKNILIKPNIYLIIVMSFFSFYKFHTFNYGIGAYDSFPSIQKVEMKKDILWKFNIKKYSDCKEIVLNFKKHDYYNTETISDRFKSIYLTIYLLDNNFVFKDLNKLVNLNTETALKCEVSNL